MAGNSNSGRQNWEKPWTDTLRRLVFANDKKGLEKIASVVVKQAMEGDPAAWKEIADRLDGKPVQQTENYNLNEHVFAEVPKTDTIDEWKQSLAVAAGRSSPVLKQH